MAAATRTKTKKGQSELLQGGEFPYRTYPYREDRERRGSLPSLPPQTPRPFKVNKGVPYREPPTPLGAEQKRYRDYTMVEPTPPMGTQSLTGSLSDLGAAGGGGSTDEGFRIPAPPPPPPLPVLQPRDSNPTGTRAKTTTTKPRDTSRKRGRTPTREEAREVQGEQGDRRDDWRPSWLRTVSRGGDPSRPPNGGGGGGGDDESDTQSVLSEGDAQGLYRMFLHLSKPVANLNDPEKRNNQETLERNLRHLGKITAQNVSRGIEDDLRSMLEELSESITQSTARHAEEIAKYVSRIERLEENERLTARAQIEKQDAVRPLPSYPRQGASSEVFQKALTATGLAVKVIERKTLFSTDPFNFIMVLATESNKIAHAHRLTSSQQRDLILSYIPTNSPEYSLLELCGTLQEIFAVISTYSDQVYTRAELEKKINQ
jgi:hypothetical protein